MRRTDFARRPFVRSSLVDREDLEAGNKFDYSRALLRERAGIFDFRNRRHHHRCHRRRRRIFRLTAILKLFMVHGIFLSVQIRLRSNERIFATSIVGIWMEISAAAHIHIHIYILD